MVWGVTSRSAVGRRNFDVSMDDAAGRCRTDWAASESQMSNISRHRGDGALASEGTGFGGRCGVSTPPTSPRVLHYGMLKAKSSSFLTTLLSCAQPILHIAPWWLLTD